jgi:hypothetical protein
MPAGRFDGLFTKPSYKVVPKPETGEGPTVECFIIAPLGTISTLGRRRHRQSAADPLADAGHACRHRRRPYRHTVSTYMKARPKPSMRRPRLRPISSSRPPACNQSRGRPWSGHAARKLGPAFARARHDHERPRQAALVEEALRAGAHQVLVLPTTASTLYRRFDWLINDDRPFELKAEPYVLAGMEKRLSLSFQHPVYIPAESGLSRPPSRPTRTTTPDTTSPRRRASHRIRRAGQGATLAP